MFQETIHYASDRSMWARNLYDEMLLSSPTNQRDSPTQVTNKELIDNERIGIWGGRL